MGDSDDWNIKSPADLSEVSGEWEPSPEEIVKVYAEIDNLILTYNWEGPGYRSSSPTSPCTPEPQEQEDSHQDKDDDFDFTDEMSLPSLRVRKAGEVELKGSAKKKTASLDGVLSSMRRHWRLQQMQEKENSEKKE